MSEGFFARRGKMELGAWVGDEDFLNHKHTKNTKVGEERPGEARRPLEGVLETSGVSDGDWRKPEGLGLHGISDSKISNNCWRWQVLRNRPQQPRDCQSLRRVRIREIPHRPGSAF